MKKKTYVVWSALTAILFLTSGCLGLWRENINFQFSMLEAPRQAPPVKNTIDSSLWIADVTVLPPFNARSFVMRNDSVQYSYSYRNEFLINPSANFRNIFYQWYLGSPI